MKRPALALAALLFSFAPAALPEAGAQDKPAKKDKKEKDAPETPVLQAEAQGLLDALGPKIDAEQWVDVLAATRELLDKHGQDLVLAETPDSPSDVKKGVLHVPAGTALRRRLAAISPEGRTELVRLAADDPETRLASARASLAPSRLVEVADRYFFAETGGWALIEAGDLYAERGSLVAASFAWREVLDHHPLNGLRTVAARRLVGLLPAIGDGGTARALRRELRHTLEWDVPARDALVQKCKEVAADLDKLDLVDQCVTSTGAVAPLGSAIWPVKKKHAHSLDEVSKELDWRAGEPTRVEQGGDGQFLAGIPRLTFGSAVTDDWILVHLGRQIHLFDTRQDGGSPVKVGKKNLGAFLGSLRRAPILARYGLALEDRDEGTVCYATIRTGPILAQDPVPLGALVKFVLPDPRHRDSSVDLAWPTEKEPAEEEEGGPRRRKKKDQPAAPAEGQEEQLSFVGTPLPAGDRVFCGAYLAGQPNQTFVAAVDAATGTLLWKRALATTDSFQTAVQQWEAPVSRPLPAPVLSWALGTLVVLSNNGCLAAVEPEDGRIVWARSYERDGNERGSRTPWNHPPEEILEARGYGWNPVLPLGDVGVACPQDSPKAILVRLSTGEGLSVKPRKTEGQGTYRYLLGNWGGRLVLEGDGWLATYDLTEDDKTGKIELSRAWESRLDSRRTNESGRGYLAGHWALVPVARPATGTDVKLGLLAFDVKSDDSKDVRTEILDWEKPANEAGDLVVGDGRFAVVSARYAHLYQVKKKKKHDGEGQ